MTLDDIGQFIWYMILATPVISFIILSRIKEMATWRRIILGILLTFLFAMILAFVSLAIILRDGLGPT